MVSGVVVKPVSEQAGTVTQLVLKQVVVTEVPKSVIEQAIWQLVTV